MLGFSSNFPADGSSKDIRGKLETMPVGMPVEKKMSWISSNYGERILEDEEGRKTYDFHSGIDIAIEEGSPVKSMALGLVVYAGIEGNYGNVVKIDHEDGYRTVYAHLRKISVPQGACVKRGKRIAEVGSTGRVLGTHLHLEVQQWDDCLRKYVSRDPIGYITAKPPVLFKF